VRHIDAEQKTAGGARRRKEVEWRMTELSTRK
jgi:hypothetical protein